MLWVSAVFLRLTIFFYLMLSSSTWLVSLLCYVQPFTSNSIVPCSWALTAINLTLAMVLFANIVIIIIKN